MDTFSKAERSKIMASVKSKGAKSTEIRFISILRKNKITGWRRNHPLAGSPDFVFPRLRTAIFLDGCFWHGCLKHCRMPSTNKKYWNNKIASNKKRDKKITKLLKMKGWRVIRIWEHSLREGGKKRKSKDKGQK